VPNWLNSNALWPRKLIAGSATAKPSATTQSCNRKPSHEEFV
jgi:hypothetical protein